MKLKTNKTVHFVAMAVLILTSSAVKSGIVDHSVEDVNDFWTAEFEKATRTATSPRIREADEDTGEGLLEAFGVKCLPNAYANYQELRASAKEREQILQENFPNGRESDDTGGKLYDKVNAATKKAVAEMFRSHDEISMLYLLHMMGAVTDQQLSDMDSTSISVVLPDEGTIPAAAVGNIPELSMDKRDFAAKYLPETLASFQRFENLFVTGKASYSEWNKNAVLVDACRSGPLFEAFRNRLLDIKQKMDGIIKFISENKLLHAVGEMSVSQLSALDHEKGLAMQNYEKELLVGTCALKGFSLGVRQSQNKVMVAKRMIEDMVPIRRPVMMGKYEVTELQWSVILNRNYYSERNSTLPVNEVSVSTVKDFLQKLNAMPVVKRSGFKFRIPTSDEWEFACNAGVREYGTDYSLDQKAWHEDNSGGRRHPVGEKRPNVFGLYDMLGNVGELAHNVSAADSLGGYHEFCFYGGSYGDSRDRCKSYESWSSEMSWKSAGFGFRLCADNLAKKVIKTELVKKTIDSMVRIPGKNYKMGRYEVSQELWATVIGDYPACFKDPSNPVENVSWNDCQEFLKKLNEFSAVKNSGLVFRLPTEEEWEYACRAGSTGDYCLLADGTEITEDTLGRVAWFEGNSGGETHPVGQKSPNAFGLYDMHGNVSEWTLTANGKDRIYRGGSWGNLSGRCESSSRGRSSSSKRYRNLGFRLCADEVSSGIVKTIDDENPSGTASEKKSEELDAELANLLEVMDLPAMLDFSVLVRLATDANQLMNEIEEGESEELAISFYSTLKTSMLIKNLDHFETIVLHYKGTEKKVFVNSEEAAEEEIKKFIEALPDNADKQTLLKMDADSEE